MRLTYLVLLTTAFGCPANGPANGGAIAGADSIGHAEFPRRYRFLRETVLTEEQSRDIWASLPYDSISLERTACYGVCPQYTVMLGKVGRAEYRGLRYTPRTGTWYGYLDHNTFGRLSHLIELEGIELLARSYEADWTDDTTAILRIWRRGDPHPIVISDYGEQGPTELWAVREAIDGIAASTEWREGAWRPWTPSLPRADSGSTAR